MKRIAIIVVVLVICGYFVNTYIKDRAEREAQRAEREQANQKTRSLVAQMVARNDAADDWANQLSKGQKIRYEPILTVELENLWLVNRPILFVGAIKDIATKDESHYTVLFERSIFASLNQMFETGLQLSLSSPKERIDAVLREHPELFENYGFNNGVAVIAQVDAIRSAFVLGENGERLDVKIGEGELMDITYTGIMSF